MKMFGVNPDPEMWHRANVAMLNGAADVNAGVMLVTLLSGCESILVTSGLFPTTQQARAHLAAMLISPNDGKPGSLLPMLEHELKRLGWVNPKAAS